MYEASQHSNFVTNYCIMKLKTVSSVKPSSPKTDIIYLQGIKNYLYIQEKPHLHRERVFGMQKWII